MLTHDPCEDDTQCHGGTKKRVLYLGAWDTWSQWRTRPSPYLAWVFFTPFWRRGAAWGCGVSYNMGVDP